MLRGDADAARALAEPRLAGFLEDYGEEHTSVTLREVLADALLMAGDLDGQAVQVDSIEAWAAANDAAPALCGAFRRRAAAALAADEPEVAASACAEGLRVARELGLGLDHVDLLILSAECSLRLGEPTSALHAVATALFGQVALEPGVPLYSAPARDDAAPSARATDDWAQAAGIFPPAASGRPSLLAATHPNVRYVWGEAAGRALLAESLLARLAQAAGSATWVPSDETARAARVIARAKAELERAAALFDELDAPERREEALRTRIAELEDGLITHYRRCITIDSTASRGDCGPRGAGHKIVVSYSHRDAPFAAELADRLDEAFPGVWIDRRTAIGESFVSAINTALEGTTDFVLIYSKAALSSLWVEHELSAAVAMRNRGRSLAIRPVVIDDTELPAIISHIKSLRSSPGEATGAATQLVHDIRGAAS